MNPWLEFAIGPTTLILGLALLYLLFYLVPAETLPTSATIMLVLFYFIPSLVAWSTNNHNTMAIFALNVLLGWTGIGWVAAFIWALAKPAPETPDFPNRTAWRSPKFLPNAAINRSPASSIQQTCGHTANCTNYGKAFCPMQQGLPAYSSCGSFSQSQLQTCGHTANFTNYGKAFCPMQQGLPAYSSCGSFSQRNLGYWSQTAYVHGHLRRGRNSKSHWVKPHNRRT